MNETMYVNNEIYSQSKKIFIQVSLSVETNILHNKKIHRVDKLVFGLCYNNGSNSSISLNAQNALCRAFRD